MLRLLKFGSSLSNPRYCGVIGSKIKSTTKLIATARCYMTKTSQTMETRLREMDLVPKDFHIVYRGGMDYYIHLAHNSSTILTFLGIGAIYRTIFIEDDPVEFPIQAFGTAVGIQNWTQIGIMYAAFFMMMYGLRQISTKYVFRMYYNPETNTYRAIKVGFLPMATSAHDFPAGILTRATKRRLIPWYNGVYNANGTKIMVFGHGFKTNADYNRLFKDG